MSTSQIKNAVITTAVTLGVIWFLNMPFMPTRPLVQKALA